MPGDQNQLRLSFAETGEDTVLREYAVLAASLDEEVLSIAQLYRDHADCENAFDELKNQWGWGGFTTKDLARCRLAARMVALACNWWNIFVRLTEPDKHMEAITSRPLLLASVARFLHGLVKAAERLSDAGKWAQILAHAFRSWPGGLRCALHRFLWRQPDRYSLRQ